jgi:hypothetical protein
LCACSSNSGRSGLEQLRRDTETPQPGGKWIYQFHLSLLSSSDCKVQIGHARLGSCCGNAHAKQLWKTNRQEAGSAPILQEYWKVTLIDRRQWKNMMQRPSHVAADRLLRAGVQLPDSGSGRDRTPAGCLRRVATFLMDWVQSNGHQQRPMLESATGPLGCPGFCASRLQNHTPQHRPAHC